MKHKQTTNYREAQANSIGIKHTTGKGVRAFTFMVGYFARFLYSSGIVYVSVSFSALTILLTLNFLTSFDR
jgi:hypothetical protein